MHLSKITAAVHQGPTQKFSLEGRYPAPEFFFIFHMEMVHFGAFVRTVFTESQN